MLKYHLYHIWECMDKFLVFLSAFLRSLSAPHAKLFNIFAIFIFYDTPYHMNLAFQIYYLHTFPYSKLTICILLDTCFFISL